MAEAIINHLAGDQWQAFSAGTQPSGYVHPLALKALEEIGIRHSGDSKSVDRFRGEEFDVVITVCDDAGFGDIGYNNHWTVELTAHAPGGVYLTVGERFAQVLFQRAETPPIEKYTGQYTANEWPQCMIPRKYRNFEHMHRWAEIPSFAIFDMDWVAGN